jgi:hypothetical protein
MHSRKTFSDGVVGVNIGKNKSSDIAVDDYVLGIQRLVLNFIFKSIFL